MPRRQVKVREHARRKPHSEQLTHVEFYIRTEELGRRRRPGARSGLDDDWRTCEICGRKAPIVSMTRLRGGEWICNSCEGKSVPPEKELDIDEETEQIEAIERELHGPLAQDKDVCKMTFSEQIAEIREHIKSECDTVSVTRGKGTAYDWIQIRGSGKSGEFTDKEREALKRLGLRPGTNLAVISPDETEHRLKALRERS